MGALDIDNQPVEYSPEAAAFRQRQIYLDTINKLAEARALKEQQEALREQQLMAQRAAEEQRKAAAAPLELAKAQEEQRRITLDNQNKEDERQLKLADADVLAWMINDKDSQGKPSGYRTLFKDAPAEAKQHVLDAYGSNAPKVANMWDEQARKMTGNQMLGMTPPEGMQEETTFTTKLNDGTSVTKRYNKPAPAQFDSFTTPQEVQANLPKEEYEVAKMVANNEMLPATAFARFPADKRTRLLAAAKAINPEWSEDDAKARFAAYKDIKSGKDSQTLQSLNTVISHIHDLKKKYDALNPSEYRAINKLSQALSPWGKGGNAALAGFTNAQSSVATELARLFRGGTPGQSESDREIKHLSPEMPPDEMNESIKTLMGLVAGRVNALNQKLTNSKMDKKNLKFLSPASIKALQELGVDYHDIDPLHPDDTKEDSTSKATSDPLASKVQTPAAPAKTERDEAIEWLKANPKASPTVVARIKKAYGIP